MGRQFRPARRGSGDKFVTAATVTGASSVLVVIPNYGVTDLSTYAAGDWVMDAPEEGVQKTLISVSSTSVARVIRMATDASVKVGGGGATQITFGQSTLDQCVVLRGVNSTRWCLESVYPVAASAAGLAFGTS
jgi:hypothetical protein